MKKLLLVTILLGALLTGCSCNNFSSDCKDETRYFKMISREDIGIIVYDTRTGVEYWMSESNYNGGLTVLVDADGKPLIYKE